MFDPPMQAGSLHYVTNKAMEISYRRSLPHWYVPGAAHFVTYRVAGTLPLAAIKSLREKRERLLAEKTGKPLAKHRLDVHRVLFAAYEKYLDTASDIDWLCHPRVASMLRQNLYHHDGVKYVLHAYCIMPNHVHLLLTPSPELATQWGKIDSPMPIGESTDKRSPLAAIMHSLKSYTANRANKILQREGEFWQPESYDHWVRDDDELERIVNYIHANPVAAGLVDRHEDWHWCSCHDRYLLDGDRSGWLCMAQAASL
ncbi:MAG: hypothetical protein KDB14_35010 [Planctomycetales bacterium]|nr:hypothetical protein [Planctomycetales bacterium]